MKIKLPRHEYKIHLDELPEQGTDNTPCLTQPTSRDPASPEDHCLQKQYNEHLCVYAISMTSEEVTTVSA